MEWWHEFLSLKFALSEFFYYFFIGGFMAEKDIAEKTLEAYNDVFSDIVNGLPCMVLKTRLQLTQTCLLEF